MLILLFHGLAGGWDELIIAVAAIGVLWVAVKLAGRKSADDDGEQEEAAGSPVEDEQPDHAAPKV
jgi:hypothetical protein